MAANLLPVPPPSLTVRSSAGGNQKPDSQRKSWWTPLFGWSSEPDYIDSAKSGFSEPDPDRKTVINRSPSAAKFTDEKARKLRMLTVETESFHDAMYHSAIASRLASDFSDRSDL